MNQNLILILIASLCFIVIFILNGTTINKQQSPALANGISLQHTTKNKIDNPVKVRVLFIGNSYTFFYDMPEMIVKIADSAPIKSEGLLIQAITKGGATLKQHWNENIAPSLVKSQKWDYIVLQEQSIWAMFPERRLETKQYAKNFADLASLNNATPVIYQTWPRKEFSGWYQQPQYADNLKNYTHMQDTIKIQTEAVANFADTKIVPVSDYWGLTKNQETNIELYDPDGSHPSVQGSYLTALIFYRYFLGQDPQKTTYIPPGVSKKEAEKLRKIVSYGDLNQ